VVKRALIESDIIKLCRFFGQHKSEHCNIICVRACVRACVCVCVCVCVHVQLVADYCLV